MIDILSFAILGSLAGVVVGLVPGIGPAQLLAIAYLALLSLDPVQLAVFYIGLITTSQYLDSVPATYFGVPGETSAVPASYEGPRLMAKGLGQASIRITAIGRVLASSIAVVLALMLFSVIIQSTWIFKNNTQLVLLALALVGVAITSQSTWWKTMTAMTLGYVIGKVGFDYTTGQDVLTFGLPQLQEGIPLMSVLMGIYVIPLLLTELAKAITLDHVTLPPQQTAVKIGPYVPTMLRSSILGWFLGLIPGLSYILSATGSYAYEKWRRIKKSLYTPGDMHTIVAAETGNTSGAFSTMIPLMIFGHIRSHTLQSHDDQWCRLQQRHIFVHQLLMAVMGICHGQCHRVDFLLAHGRAYGSMGKQNKSPGDTDLNNYCCVCSGVMARILQSNAVAISCAVCYNDCDWVGLFENQTGLAAGVVCLFATEQH